MKNLHLIPINIQDIVENLNNATNINEKNNYLLRLETIRDYCDETIKKTNTKSLFDEQHKRKAATGKNRK